MIGLEWTQRRFFDVDIRIGIAIGLKIERLLRRLQRRKFVHRDGICGDGVGSLDGGIRGESLKERGAC